MVKSGFKFDIIITQIDTPDKEFPDPNSLAVDVNFINVPLSITASRINVDEFRAGRSYEFETSPEYLRCELEHNPLKLEVKYNDDVVANGCMQWPSSVLNKINDTLNELTHVDLCELKMNKEKIGFVELIVRLQCKCQEISSDECTQNLKKNIDPNDTIFVFGESQKQANDCDDDENQTTALDFSEYRSMNGKLVRTPVELNTYMNTDYCKLKEISNQYEQLIDSLKGGQEQQSEWACSAKSHSYQCPHDNKFSGSSSTDEDSSQTDNELPCCRFSSQHKGESAFASEKLKKICPQIPPPKKQQVDIAPTRCPVCKENLSWLPKISACPKCGYKRYIEKPRYNETLTADQILEKYVNKCSSSTEQPDHYGGNNKKPGEKRESCCAAKSNGFGKHDSTVSCDIRDYEKMLERDGRKKNENRSIRKPPTQQSLLQQHNKQQQQRQYQKQQKKMARICKKQNEVETYRPKHKPLTDAPHKETNHYGYKSESLSPVRRKVPCNMGWLWNADLGTKHRGWKPGSISKPIKELMKYFLKDYPVDTLPVSKYSYRNQGKGDCKDKPDLEQKPTLHISKKNNEYIITLRPLKDRETLKECADPYLKMKPIQFKINKNPLLVEVRKLKRCLKDMGFDKCTCHRPVIECFCRSFIDKKKLEYQLKKECEKRGLQSCNETLVLSDTTDSETEFDFGVTPPAGVVKPERLNRPNLVDQGSQYVMSDWNVPPKVPMPVNKYLRNYFCATREGRYLPEKGAGVGKKVKKSTGGAVRFKGVKGGNKEGDKGDGEAECPKGSRPPIDMLEYHNQRKALDAADKARKKEMRGKKYGMPSELLCTVMRRAKTVPCNAFCRADNWFGADRVC